VRVIGTEARVLHETLAYQVLSLRRLILLRRECDSIRMLDLTNKSLFLFSDVLDADVRDTIVG